MSVEPQQIPVESLIKMSTKMSEEDRESFFQVILNELAQENTGISAEQNFKIFIETLTAFKNATKNAYDRKRVVWFTINYKAKPEYIKAALEVCTEDFDEGHTLMISIERSNLTAAKWICDKMIKDQREGAMVRTLRDNLSHWTSEAKAEALETLNQVEDNLGEKLPREWYKASLKYHSAARKELMMKNVIEQKSHRWIKRIWESNDKDLSKITSEVDEFGHTKRPGQIIITKTLFENEILKLTYNQEEKKTKPYRKIL